jgi:lipopolysaccharide transport system ATP-binding protein
MSNIAVSVKNLSKIFLINHQKTKKESYQTLQSFMMELPLNFFIYLQDRYYKRKGYQKKSLEEFHALTDVSFDIKRGQRVGLIGRNGAGKSTLLKILSRITEPNVGEIAINGRIASLLEVGTGFHPELTGRENIYLNGAILGMSKEQIRKNFDDIVKFSEVEQFIDTPVKRYSSGMYVRLAFAVAAHLESDILLIDEVLAVGDSRFQKKCLEKMREITASDRTIIFVSHQSDSIRKLCDTVIWLDKGKVVMSGDSGLVVDAYEKSNLTNVLEADGVFLRNRRHIKNSGMVFISAVRMRSLNDNRLDVYSTSYKYGERFMLEIELNEGEAIQPGCYIVWSLFNDAGQLIGGSDTNSAGISLSTTDSTIKCEIGPLNLYKRRFYLEIGVGAVGLERFDTWTDEVYFDIFSSDPYANGSSYDSKSGSVHISHHWNKN